MYIRLPASISLPPKFFGYDVQLSMNADDFRDYMLSFLFLRYLSDNYEYTAQKELTSDYPLPDEEDKRASLALWYEENKEDVPEFEKQMRRKVHYVIEPQYLWSNITELATRQPKPCHSPKVKTRKSA